MSLFSSERHWFHPQHGLRTLPMGTKDNHTSDIIAHPEVYGVDVSGVRPDQNYDYNGEILYKAMLNNWVRIRFNRRNPDHGSNIEGTNFRALHKAAQFIAEKVPGIQQMIVVKRNSPDDSDAESFLLNHEGVEQFLRFGRPNPKYQVHVPKVAAEGVDPAMIDLKTRAGLNEAGAGPSRIQQHIQSGRPFFAMSAERGERSGKKNREAMHILKTRLSQLGIPFIQVHGGWPEQLEQGGTRDHFEASVFGMPKGDLKRVKHEVIKLAKHFAQDGIIWGQEGTISFIDTKSANDEEFPIGNAVTFAKDKIDQQQGFSKIKNQKFAATDSSEPDNLGRAPTHYGEPKPEKKIAAAQ